MDSPPQFVDKSAMGRGDKLFLTGAGIALGLALIFGWALQPQQPYFPRNGGYHEEPANYHAGGSGCEPANLKALPARVRASKTDACAEAAEQHREATNNFVEARRSAVAAEASAIYAAAEARIGAWESALGFMTLIAAVAAAFFAKKAADHTERSADAARDALKHQIETSNRQLRAYVSIGIPTITPMRDGVWAVRFPLLNTGQTPATNVVVRVGTGVSPFPVQRAAIRPDHLHAIKVADIAPKGERVRMFEHEISDDDMNTLRGDACYIYGLQVSYNTFVGEAVEDPDYWWFARAREFMRGHPTSLEHQFANEDPDQEALPFGTIPL